jgi:iron complex transport system substrate-binding protein
MMRKILLVVVLLLQPFCLWSAEYPFTFRDSPGHEIILSHTPNRVVSLVPSITEMLIQMGVSDAIVGRTYHSVLPTGAAAESIVGGFFQPDPDRIAALKPDVLFYADIHKEMVSQFKGKMVLICLSQATLQESFTHLRLLGKMFNAEDEAAAIIAEQQRLLDIIALKTEGIPQQNKQRVMRLMGMTPDVIMVPGDDSFQNQYIQAAGGIAPQFGRKGSIISINFDELQTFNPQVIYACGNNQLGQKILEQQGWKDVDAVRNRRILNYPCDLTCRASTHTGYFVSWLSANIYNEEFSDPNQQVFPDGIVKHSAVPLALEYVQHSEIIETSIRDFRNKSLIVTLDRPMKVLSTLEGMRENVLHAGNHYFPAPSWGLGHNQGLSELRLQTLKVLGLEQDNTAILFTGADMANLAVVKKSFRDMEVTALVTAGVRGNALRMAQDTGLFYEPDATVSKKEKPGTINIILLSNMQLSPRAMTRALISATEGKTAALSDLDVRSSYSGKINPATGTGTDNILVIEGSGSPIDATGGHTKMGELIARAVYEGVQEAIQKQNKLTAGRSIFQRMLERKMKIRELGRYYSTDEQDVLQVERLLLSSEYSAFLEAALAISDAYERGLITDLTSYDEWCAVVAGQIAGKPVQMEPLKDTVLPVVLHKAVAALFTGVQNQRQAHN